MGKIKKIMALNIAMVILVASLTACGNYDTKDVTDKAGSEDVSEITGDTAQDVDSDTADERTSAPKTPEEITLVLETYEDYMKLAAAGYENEDWEIAHDCYLAAKELDGSRAEVYRGLSDTYLQMGDVIQALDILDEGMEKCVDEHSVDSLGQRKEYILAGMVAVRISSTSNEYYDDGSICLSSVSECDDNGYEKRYESVHYYENGESSSNEEYRYDSAGNNIEYKYISCDNDGNTIEFVHTIWEYDSAGNEIGYVTYDENGNIERRKECEYDANGNQTKEIYYDKDDKIQRKTEKEYDAAGNVINSERYGSDVNYCRNRDTYTYDEYGKQIIHVAYRDGKITEKCKYEYDENGNIIKTVIYKNTVAIDYWFEYEYDENGRLIKFVRYESDGTAGLWDEYEYDENDNVIWHKYNNDKEYHVQERKYDECGREIYIRYESNGVVTDTWENEYDKDGYIIKEIKTEFDSDTGQKTFEEVSEYTYDEKGNGTKYVCTSHAGKETNSLRWEKEYSKDGRGTDFHFYNNEKTASYQGKTEYDENGLIINYMGCDKNGKVLVMRKTEYDASGKVIKESYNDEDSNLNQYYENEYDDFGSITRQIMYEGGILKAEKQMSYVYHYIGNIDAEAADYMDSNMAPKEYNQKLRDVFTRFLNGQEKVRYYRNEYDSQDGKIVEETITDLIYFAYYIEHEKTIKYTFLDMTGDGKEELIISCAGGLCVIQCSCNVLKVIYDDGGKFSNYLIKYNGKTGICRSFSGYMSDNTYYFFDENGNKSISLKGDLHSESEMSFFSCENESLGWHYISEGEYYDIMSGMVEKMDIDWQKLEIPSR